MRLSLRANGDRFFLTAGLAQAEGASITSSAFQRIFDDAENTQGAGPSPEYRLARTARLKQMTVNAAVGKESPGDPRAFATARWSLILSAAKSESGEQKPRATHSRSFAGFDPALIPIQE